MEEKPSVGQRGIRRAVAAIEAAPHSPSAVDAVVSELYRPNACTVSGVIVVGS